MRRPIIFAALTLAACAVTADLPEPPEVAPLSAGGPCDGHLQGCTLSTDAGVLAGRCLDGVCCVGCIDDSVRPSVCVAVPEVPRPYTGVCGPCGVCPGTLLCHVPSNLCRPPCDAMGLCPDSGNDCWQHACDGALCLPAALPDNTPCMLCDLAGHCESAACIPEVLGPPNCN